MSDAEASKIDVNTNVLESELSPLDEILSVEREAPSPMVDGTNDGSGQPQKEVLT